MTWLRDRWLPVAALLAATGLLIVSIAWTVGSGAFGWRPDGSSAMGPDSSMLGVEVGDEADYLARMVAHHAEAVQAARQLQRSDRAQLRSLGASIVTTQSAEIVTMKGWLEAWYPGRSTTTGYQPMMRDLSKLYGDVRDEVFLRDMIPHHMGAIMMSQQLLMRGGIQHAEVATFAVKVRDAQHAEVIRMRQWLAVWFDERSMPMPTGAG